jgi:hypothetical protein
MALYLVALEDSAWTWKPSEASESPWGQPSLFWGLSLRYPLHQDASCPLHRTKLFTLVNVVKGR